MHAAANLRRHPTQSPGTACDIDTLRIQIILYILCTTSVYAIYNISRDNLIWRYTLHEDKCAAGFTFTGQQVHGIFPLLSPLASCTGRYVLCILRSSFGVKSNDSFSTFNDRCVSSRFFLPSISITMCF